MELTKLQQGVIEGQRSNQNPVYDDFASDVAKNNKVFNEETGLFEDKSEMGMGESFSQTFSASREEGAALLPLLRRSIDESFDPDFKFTEEVDKEISEFDPVFHEFLYEASSREELDMRLASVQTTMANQKILAESLGDNPITTVLAMLSAGVFTEENAAIALVPILGQAAAGTNALRATGTALTRAGQILNMNVKGKTALGTAGKVGTIGAGYGAVFAGMQLDNIADYDYTDALLEIVIGAGIGGTLGYVGDKAFRHVNNASAQAAASTAAPTNFPRLPAPDDSGSNYGGPNIDFEAMGAPEQGQNLRGTNWISKIISDGAALRDSENPIIRGLARAMVQDNRINGDAVNTVAASTHQRRIMYSTMNKFTKGVQLEYRKWKKKHGKRFSMMNQHRFMEDVTRATRDEGFYNTAPEEVKRAADAQAKLYHDLLKMKKEAGVKGADGVEFDRWYAPVEWDSQLAKRKIDMFGEQQLAHKVIANAIMKANPEWNPMLARKLGAMFLRRVKFIDVDNAVTDNLGDMFEDVELLKQAMVDDGSFSADEIKDVFRPYKEAKRPANTKTKDVNLRQRLRMDYYAEFEVKAKDGTIHKVKAADFLQNDAHDLMQKYAFKAGRHIGMARNGIDNVNGKSFAEIIKEAEAWQVKNGTDSEKFARDLERLQDVMLALQGGAMKQFGPATTAAMQGVRNLSYLAYSGFFGLSSIIETANIVGYYGLRNTLKVLPAFKEIMRDGKTGKLKGEEMDLMVDALGVGSAGFRGQTSSRVDEVGHMFETTSSRLGVLMDRAREFYGRYTGLTGITDVSQRLALAVIRKQWLSGDIPRAMRQGTGITDDMYRRIKDQINTHKNGRNLGVQNWTDLGAREAFYNHLSIEIRNSIQETDVGSTNRVMRSQLGQTLFQFMSFAFGSHEQQYARMYGRATNGMARRAAITVMGQMMLSTLVGIARVHAGYSGRSDEREKIKEQLEWENLSLLAIQYTGAFGLMSNIAGIPGYIDSIGGGEGATTLVNNPSLGFINNIGRTIHQLAEDGELDERGYRTLLHSVPMLWNVWTASALNEIANELGN